MGGDRPLLPKVERRARHPGRKRHPDRLVFKGILFVLHTRISWEHLPQELGFGSGMTCWRRLVEWTEAGVWPRLPEVLLAKLRSTNYRRRGQRRAGRVQRYVHSRQRRPRTGHRMNAATIPEPRTAAALAARRRKTETALERVHQAIARLRREKAQVSVAAVARRAAVSRTFLYDNIEARAAVAAAIAQASERRTQMLTEQDDEREATWCERALNAEEALKATHTEILFQRTRIGELLGQIRGLEAEWTQEAIQRITTENTTLKQRVRQLTTDNRTLDERLKAARSNPPLPRPPRRRPRSPDHRTGTNGLIASR